MTVSELFATLRELQVHVWAEGDRVRCSAPRGVLTPELQEELRKNRVEILRYLKSATSSNTPAHPLGPVPTGEEPALSFFQERLWILNRLDPGNTAYNLVASLRVPATLDPTALEASVTEIVRRHQALRCAFREVAGTPVVVVNPPGPVRPVLVDLRHVSRPEREAALTRLAASEATVPFQLEQGGLFRVSGIVVADDELVLLVAMHHIITDAWSLGIFLQEWFALYQAIRAGQPSPLRPVAIQYPDYGYWERRWLRESILDTHVEYWKAQLSGAPHVLTLPTDRPRPPMQSYDGAVQGFELPADLADRLRATCRDEGVTIFMALLATFDVVLQRYTGQNDLLVGSPIATRNRPELEGTLGPFLNSLVLRTSIAPDDTSRTLRARVRQTLLQGQAHQDVPFGRLVELINPERSLAYSPLFQVAFMFQNSPGRSAFSIDTGGAMYDLTLNGWEVGATIGASFEYATALFDAPTIARIAAHFLVLLDEMVREPDRPLAEIPILSAAEREQMLVRWNDTAREYPRDQTVSQLFEAQAARTPERVAVASGDTTWTYRVLDRRANQLARYLAREGIGPGSRVAICLDRSPRLLATLLGVLKSGAAYVPLDPQYPPRRVQFMLEDSGAALVVSEEVARQSLGGAGGPKILSLDAIDAALADEEEGNLPALASPADPSYVIYTSGSTGRPKGVEVSHGGLANLLRSMQREPGLTQDDVLCAITTIAFDIAGLELYLPLLVGARVEIASSATAQDGRRLQEYLARCGATVMQATPATWQMLIDTGWHPNPKSAGISAWCGGDSLSRDLAEALLLRARSVWNLYGPTETTIWSAASKVVSSSGPVLIGRPIANTQIYVLDPTGQPVPVGVAGEIFIGGDGVARGYVNRPDLTDERFLADHFSSKPGNRLYRTGDVGRWRASGELEHMGRVDHQVKLRGFRIELGEIEAVLASHPAVTAAIAAVRASRLVGYVVTDSGSVLTATDARRFLRERLPDYMVPMHVVSLDQFPLTPNGKIDRAVLPDPFSGTSQGSDNVPPETPMERALAQLWQELLGLSHVSVHKTFFDLGGHSLLAVKASYEIERLIGRPLDVRVLFFETLRQVAARCDQMSTAGTGASRAGG